VNDLIKVLGLEHVQNIKCGNQFVKTISGGERKRTCIGVELITDPKLLFLDEPTSGLDSHLTISIVMLLKKLARERGMTVLSTIHQPSSQAFAHFDRTMLMCDGHIIYQGPATYTKAYLRELGYKFP